MIQLEGVAAALAILAVTVFPVMLAARFAGAGRPGFVPSLIAVVVAGIASYLAFWIMGGSLAGALLAFVVMCIVYSIVLEVSIPKSFGVAIMVFSLQVILGLAVVSFGVNFGKVEALPTVHVPADPH